MNYSAARQRKDGRWDWTRNGHADGYCYAWKEWGDEQVARVFGSGERARERYEEFAKPYRAAAAAGKFHDTGHETKEEAVACHKAFELDFNLRVREDDPEARSQHRCRFPGCNAWTSGYVQIGAYCIIQLCADHRTREAVEQVYQHGDQRWDS